MAEKLNKHDPGCVLHLGHVHDWIREEQLWGRRLHACGKVHDDCNRDGKDPLLCVQHCVTLEGMDVRQDGTLEASSVSLCLVDRQHARAEDAPPPESNVCEY